MTTRTAKHAPYYYWQRMVAEFKGARGCRVEYFQGNLSLTYHNTKVADWDTLGGTITLNHGGWLTYYTKERINRFVRVLDLGAAVYQRRKRWFVMDVGTDKDTEWDTLDGGYNPVYTLETTLVQPKTEKEHVA